MIISCRGGDEVVTCYARKGLVLAGVLTALTAIQGDFFSAQAQSQQEAGAAKNFDIPAAPLRDALNTFSRQSGISVALDSNIPADTVTVPVKGSMDPAHALGTLLRNSSLAFQFVGDRSVRIMHSGISADSNSMVLPVLSLEGTHLNAASQNMAHISVEPGSSGYSNFGEGAIKSMAVGERDPMKLLRILPNVNWDNDEYMVKDDSEQDLSPAHVSISGGRVYDNAVYLNGMSNRWMDEYSIGADQSATTMPGGNPMALFPHTNTLEEVAAYDSNVPAEYSGFTGGVIEMRTKRPTAERKAWIGHSQERSEWTQYRRVGNPDKDPVQYRKYSSEAGWSGALGETTNLMVNASRVTAETMRTYAANYGGKDLGMTQTHSDNFQIALNQKIGDNWVANLQGSYMPYERQYMAENRIDGGEIITKGKGRNLNADFDYAGNNLDGSIKIGYSTSGYNRDAPDNFFNWNNSGTLKQTICKDVTATTCSIGGYGDIYREQEDFQIRGKISSELVGVKWTSGLDFKSTIASRGRNSETNSFTNIRVASVTCLDGDLGCLNNQQFAKTRWIYLPFHAEEDMNSYGLYLQGEKRIDLGNDWIKALDIRAGVRGDYDDYMRNYNIAPRLSVTAELPHKWALTLGANRYYSESNLVYALRAHEAKSYEVYTRTNTYAPWGTTPDSTKGTIYRNNDLETPYSDEGTMALTAPVSETGKARLKYIQRKNRNELASKFITPDSAINREITNEGWTDYQGASLEYEHSFKNHAFLFGLGWSSTKRAGLDYDYYDDDSYGDSGLVALRSKWVYYNGELTKHNVVRTFASNMAQPWVFNFAWSSTWLEDKLRLNVNGKYRFARDGIEQVGTTPKNQMIDLPNGQQMDQLKIHEDAKIPGIWRVNMNLNYEVATWDTQSFEVFVNVDNVFNNRTYTWDHATSSDDDGWEKGRTFWLGGRYNF